MAKNFVLEDGDVLQIVAPGARTSGQFEVIGDLAGVWMADVASGDEGAFKTDGVAELAKDTADTFAVGDLVDWDGSKIVAAAGGNKAGIVVEAVGTGVVLAKVKINAVAA